MKKLRLLLFLVATLPFQSFAQSVELNHVFTNPNKIVKIQVPVDHFVSHNGNGDCNSLPVNAIGASPSCYVYFLTERDFRKTYLGVDYMNTRDPMMVGYGYGPKVLEVLKKAAVDGLLTGNLFVKYLYQPAWHTFGSHGGPANSMCSLIEVAQASLVIQVGNLTLEFKNAPFFMTTGQPYNMKFQLDRSLCPRLL